MLVIIEHPRLVIITKIDIINLEVNEIIGKPLELQEWLDNVNLYEFHKLIKGETKQSRQ